MRVPWRLNTVTTANTVFSKLKAKRRGKSMSDAKAELRFPKEPEAPKHPLKKPETGKYHVIRLYAVT